MTLTITSPPERLLDAVLTRCGVSSVDLCDPSVRRVEVVHARRLFSHLAYYHLRLSVRRTADVLWVSEVTVKRLRAEAFRLVQCGRVTSEETVDLTFFTDVVSIQKELAL